MNGTWIGLFAPFFFFFSFKTSFVLWDFSMSTVFRQINIFPFSFSVLKWSSLSGSTVRKVNLFKSSNSDRLTLSRKRFSSHSRLGCTAKDLTQFRFVRCNFIWMLAHLKRAYEWTKGLYANDTNDTKDEPETKENKTFNKLEIVNRSFVSVCVQFLVEMHCRWFKIQPNCAQFARCA